MKAKFALTLAVTLMVGSIGATVPAPAKAGEGAVCTETGCFTWVCVSSGCAWVWVPRTGNPNPTKPYN